MLTKFYGATDFIDKISFLILKQGTFLSVGIRMLIPCNDIDVNKVLVKILKYNNYFLVTLHSPLESRHMQINGSSRLFIV